MSKYIKKKNQSRVVPVRNTRLEQQRVNGSTRVNLDLLKKLSNNTLIACAVSSQNYDTEKVTK
jgi:hypothetical protein